MPTLEYDLLLAVLRCNVWLHSCTPSLICHPNYVGGWQTICRIEMAEWFSVCNIALAMQSNHATAWKSVRAWTANSFSFPCLVSCTHDLNVDPICIPTCDLFMILFVNRNCLFVLRRSVDAADNHSNTCNSNFLLLCRLLSAAIKHQPARTCWESSSSTKM